MSGSPENMACVPHQRCSSIAALASLCGSAPPLPAAGAPPGAAPPTSSSVPTRSSASESSAAASVRSPCSRHSHAAVRSAGKRRSAGAPGSASRRSDQARPSRTKPPTAQWYRRFEKRSRAASTSSGIPAVLRDCGGERGLQLGPVGAQPGQSRRLSGSPPPLSELGCRATDVIEVATHEVRPCPAFLRAIESVAAHGLQHPEPACVVVGLDDRLGDQLIECVDEGRVVQVRDRGHCCEVDTPREHRECFPQVSLRGSAELVAPVDDRTEGALAHDAVAGAVLQEGEPRRQAVEKVREGHRAHPRGCEFDRERQPVQCVAQVQRGPSIGIRQWRGRTRRTSADHEQRHRVGGLAGVGSE